MTDKPIHTLQEWHKKLDIAYKRGWHGNTDISGLARDWGRDNDILKQRIAELETSLAGRINAVYNLEQVIKEKLEIIAKLEAKVAKL